MEKKMALINEICVWLESAEIHRKSVRSSVSIYQ